MSIFLNVLYVVWKSMLFFLVSCLKEVLCLYNYIVTSKLGLSSVGSYVGAEICELLGLYILQVLGEKWEKDKIGLYRDDGFACFGTINGSQAERIRKEFISLFKTEFKLSITIETNLKIVNVLDVKTNLNTGTREPYNKPNNNLLHININ